MKNMDLHGGLLIKRMSGCLITDRLSPADTRQTQTWGTKQQTQALSDRC